VNLSRREAIASGASVAALLAAPASTSLLRREGARAGCLGLVIHSFSVRTAQDRARPRANHLSDPLVFLDYARSLGADGVQVGLGDRTDVEAAAIRERAAALSMYLEGIVSLPRDTSAVPRFEAEVRTASRAGAGVVRTVLMSGRRYESFETATEFRRFVAASSQALARAVPVAARHGIRLAVENHKDLRTDELVSLLEKLGVDHVGVCLDTGNSIALLEQPMDVIEALAPWTVTTHLKDISLEDDREGFSMAEVPFGTGILDLRRVVQAVRSARPSTRFNVEMITRDPLRVPCLTEKYFATFPELPARQLARALALVRRHTQAQRLPRPSLLADSEQLRVEEENVRKCLAFARDRLGL
jgi:sugar phosphate isomerase/epimerase